MTKSKNTIRVVALLLVCCCFLMLIPEKTQSLSGLVSISDFATFAKNVADEFAKTGVFPTTASPLGSFSKVEFFGYALACIKAIDEGKTGSYNFDRVSGFAQPSSYFGGDNFGGTLEYQDAFSADTLPKDVYMNTITRNITFAGTSPYYFARYVTYPGGGYTQYTGNFSFTRGLYTYMRVLKYYKENSSLPATIDCSDYNSLSYHTAASTSFTTQEVAKTASNAMAYYAENGTWPSSVKVGSTTISRVSFFRLMMIAINNIAQNRANKPIPYYVCISPDDPPYGSDSITVRQLTKEEYASAVRRQLIFMNTNSNKAARYITSFMEGQHLPYGCTVMMFARVLSYYKTNGELPMVVHHKCMSMA